MSGGGDGLFEEEHAPHENHERYLLTYADMITLLLALFIVLWAISNVDQQKFEEFRAGLAEGFGGPAIEGGNGILPGQRTVQDALVQVNGDGDGNLVPTTTTTTPLGTSGLPGIDSQGGGDPDVITDPTGTDVHLGGGDGLVGFEEATATELALEGLLRQADVDTDEANVSVDARGVIVTLNPDFGFAPGRYDLQPGAIAVLDQLFGPLADVTNDIRIDGHTDDVPFDGPFGNIGLSTNRAAAVYEHLLLAGQIARGQASVAGYGDTKPIATNDSAEGRAANRRIEIVLVVAPGATPPDGIPGATVETTPTTATSATTATTEPGADATSATTAPHTTESSTAAGSRPRTTSEGTPIIDHITQGVVEIPG